MIQLKARNPTALHTATMGRMDAQLQDIRADPHVAIDLELVKRYSMWVHRCVELNARTAAAVPFKLFRIAANPTAAKDCVKWFGGEHNAKLPDARMKAFLRGRMDVQPSASVKAAVRGNLDSLIEIERHPLLDLLNDVNDYTDGYAFREAKYADLQIFGRAFVHVVEQGGLPIELWRMLPQKMHVIRDPVRFVKRFDMNQGSDRQPFRVDEVIWYRLFDPDDPWGGVGPLQAWIKTVDAGTAIQDFQYELMQRFGAPDHVVTSEAPMDERQQNVFRRMYRKLFGNLGSRNRETIAFLSGTQKIERIGQTNRELEFQQSENSKRDQICNAFGVPISFVDVSQIRSNSREANQQYITYTIWPLIQRVEDTDNAQFVSRFGDGLFIAHENPIPDDETIRVAARSSKLASGYTVNEIRAEDGVEPLPDAMADTPMIGGGVMPLEQAGGIEEEEPIEEPTVEEPELLDVDVQPEQVLQGAQITAASAIVQAVIDEKIPIESARGQLVVLFNLDEAQADLMLSGVEEFEKPEPELPPMMGGGIPPNGDEQQPPPPNEAPAPASEERRLIFPPLSLIEAFQGKANGQSQPMTFNLEPHVHVGFPEMKQAPVYVQSEAPIVNVSIPEPTALPAPQVNVEAPIVNVSMPEQKSPIVNVEPPNVEVTPPNMIVEAPNVTVEAPNVDVKADVKADSPDVNVLVEPKIEINPSFELPERKVKIKRDRDTGVITGAEVEDA